MIAQAVVGDGEAFSKACNFWAENNANAQVYVEVEKLKRTAPAVAAFLETALKKAKYWGWHGRCRLTLRSQVPLT